MTLKEHAKITSLPKDLNQKLATLVHTQWSIWQENQDKRAIHGETTVEFTKETWENWNRLSNIPFKFLTNEEQKSDLEIAEKLWMPFLVEVLSRERKSFEGRLGDVAKLIDEIEKESNSNTEMLRSSEPKSERRKSVLFARIECYQWVIKRLREATQK